jgi:hypothetical protein
VTVRAYAKSNVRSCAGLRSRPRLRKRMREVLCTCSLQLRRNLAHKVTKAEIEWFRTQIPRVEDGCAGLPRPRADRLSALRHRPAAIEPAFGQIALRCRRPQGSKHGFGQTRK